MRRARAPISYALVCARVRVCAVSAVCAPQDALKWVNSRTSRELKLRGIMAKVITGGVIKSGDEVRKLTSQ